MKNYSKLSSRALVGFIIGGIIGGFAGLVIGGTFLGWIDFHNLLGLEGYELTFYLGFMFGSIAGALSGINKNQKDK